MPKKILLVILDGIADGEQAERKTTLQEAYKPCLDEFTRNGIGGLLDNQLEEREGLGPDSGVSIWTLFGYPKSDYPGRGYLDALGAGVPVKPTDVCLRANFSTVKETEKPTIPKVPLNPKTPSTRELIVVDRRAGREKEGLVDLAKAIHEINIDGMWVRFYKSLAHRGVVLISSASASPNISNSDPGINNVPVLEIKPLTKDNEAVRTATTLNKWSRKVYQILKEHRANKYRKFPANYILLRDPGMWRSLKPFSEKFGMKAAVVAASPVVRGIAHALEMDVINVVGASGDMKTNLRDKTLAALDALPNHDFVVLHILGTDVAGHERDPAVKIGYIEKIDREVFGRIREYLNTEKTVLAVTSDHLTNVFSGVHEKGAFPFCIYTKGIEPNKTQSFDEVSCKEPLGPKLHLKDFMELLLSYRG